MELVKPKKMQLKFIDELKLGILNKEFRKWIDTEAFE